MPSPSPKKGVNTKLYFWVNNRVLSTKWTIAHQLVNISRNRGFVTISGPKFLITVYMNSLNNTKYLCDQNLGDQNLGEEYFI